MNDAIRVKQQTPGSFYLPKVAIRLTLAEDRKANLRDLRGGSKVARGVAAVCLHYNMGNIDIFRNLEQNSVEPFFSTAL